VKNVVIWGNHSSTQYPDVSHGYIQDGARKVPVREAISDHAWLEGEFIKVVQGRGAAIIAARKLSSAGSAAQAICDHIQNWIKGTPEGEYVSMAVPSDGSYGVPENLIYSFPVTCANGSYSIVQGLEISAFSRNLLDATTAELVEERDTAFHFLGN
jgi:malate dehydrogenase